MYHTAQIDQREKQLVHVFTYQYTEEADSSSVLLSPAYMKYVSGPEEKRIQPIKHY